MQTEVGKTSIAEIKQAIRTLNLSSKTVAMHTSMRSFGEFETGADGLIDCFFDAGSTLLVPTFSYRCEVNPKRDIERNGINPRHLVDEEAAKTYDPVGSCSTEMGALPRSLLRRPERHRGDHPLNSLSALGSEAKALISTQMPLKVYAPYEALRQSGNGILLLAGVSLTSATPIHYAEMLAGKTLFHRWAKTSDGIVETEIGSCSNGFDRLLPVVADLLVETRVGASVWLSAPFNKFVERISNVIRGKPDLTDCGRSDCLRCEHMSLGGPIL